MMSIDDFLRENGSSKGVMEGEKPPSVLFLPDSLAPSKNLSLIAYNMSEHGTLKNNYCSSAPG